MSIGDNIRTVRKLQGLTQKELARRLGISPVGVAQWENGLRNPKHETIKRIASALGVSVTVLYGLPAKETADQQEALEKFLDESVDNQGNIDPNRFADAKYGDLGKLANMTDELYLSSLKGWTDFDLLNVIAGSFNALNRVGKIEAVKRIADLETNPRYYKIPPYDSENSQDAAEDICLECDERWSVAPDSSGDLALIILPV